MNTFSRIFRTVFVLALTATEVQSFMAPSSSRWTIVHRRPRTRSNKLTTTILLENKIRGDPLREAAGIRPSLHPLTINTVAEVLKRRSQNDPTAPLRVHPPTTQPLQVALTAGRIAAEALQRRQDASEQDGMTLTAQEKQTVAGRIVGVTMRLPELEALLVEKCQKASWIAKFNEWHSFGVLPSSSEVNEQDENALVDQKIKDDPLFGMNRAECLLALFLHTVEAPELKEKKVTVQDNSVVDFLDADRKDVLMGAAYE